MLTYADKSKAPQQSRTTESNLRSGSGHLTARETAGPRHDFRLLPIHSFARARVQPKLKVGTPGDVYEREADGVAERVLRISDPMLQRACTCGGEGAGCRKRKTPQDELQTLRADTNSEEVTTAPPFVNEVLRTSGQPLPPTVRDFMEPRFGFDFGRVRVHADGEAANAARSVQARAFTYGADIVFGEGEYSPGTSEGMRVLAHELTHVVQQSGGEGGVGKDGSPHPSSGVIQRLQGPPPPGSEQAARQVAERVLQTPAARASWRHFWQIVIRRFGLRGATAAALSAADGPLPVGELISLGLLLYTIWEILELWETLWRDAAIEAARRPVNPPEAVPRPPQPEPAPDTRPRPDTPPDTRRREPRAERCPLPRNELTEFVRWGTTARGTRAVGDWMQELVGDSMVDWTGCAVFEEGMVDDQCWVAGSPCPRETQISPPGRWTCSGNEWGLDSIGAGEACVNYYQQHSRLPCRITAYQTMHMETDRGPLPYKQNVLFTEIHSDKVVSSRDDEQEERPWPPP